MTKSWTILDLLDWTTKYFQDNSIDTPRLDAECLLAHSLNVERISLYLNFDKPIQEKERTEFRQLVSKRVTDRIPVAQLIEEKEFWSLKFKITSDVLIPRPDTEILVSVALEYLESLESQAEVLDIGTGSGVLAVAIANERLRVQVTATDISGAALAVAEENSIRHNLTDRIRFVAGDGLEAVSQKEFDLIVSNPPYLNSADLKMLAPEIAHEPKIALLAGEQGTEILENIVSNANDYLKVGGCLALELGESQAEQVAVWLADEGFEKIEFHKDLAGRRRVVSGRKVRSD